MAIDGNNSGSLLPMHSGHLASFTADTGVLYPIRDQKGVLPLMGRTPKEKIAAVDVDRRWAVPCFAAGKDERVNHGNHIPKAIHETDTSRN